MRALVIQATGAAMVTAGCFVLALWLGLIVGGLLVFVAAELMERGQ